MKSSGLGNREGAWKVDSHHPGRKAGGKEDWKLLLVGGR